MQEPLGERFNEARSSPPGGNGRPRHAGLAESILFVCILAALSFIVVFTASSSSKIRAVAEGAKTARSGSLLAQQVGDLSADLGATESAGRGYLVSGREAQAKLFDSSFAQLKRDIRAVKLSAADEPKLLRDVTDLSASLNPRFQVLQDAMQFRREKGIQALSIRPSNPGSQALVNRTHDLVTACEADAAGISRAQDGALSRQIASTVTTMVVVGGAGLLVLAALSVMSFRFLRAQARIRELERRRAADLEALVAKRTTELTEAVESLEMFSYSVSHDMRAPLRAIGGFVASIEEDLGDRLNETEMGDLARIKVNVRKMASIIDALLGLARLSRTPIDREAVNVSALAEEIAAQLGAVEFIRVEPGLTASADPKLLSILLTNLIGNAVKFSSKVSAPEIAFGLDPAQSGETFYVRDNGAGFDGNTKRNLFEPFNRLHSPREFEGTGIGLATCERIVRRHGGQIWASSSPGHGATFFFTLTATDPLRKTVGQDSGAYVR